MKRYIVTFHIWFRARSFESIFYMDHVCTHTHTNIRLGKFGVENLEILLLDGDKIYLQALYHQHVDANVIV